MRRRQILQKIAQEIDSKIEEKDSQSLKTYQKAESFLKAKKKQCQNPCIQSCPVKKCKPKGTKDVNASTG